MTNRAELLRVAEQVDTSALDQARSIIADCRRYQEMFDSAGWELFTTKLQAKATGATNRLIRGAKEMDEVQAARAELALITELLALEDDVANDLAAAQAEMEDADG